MKRIVCFLTLIICFCMTPIQAQKKMMSQEEFRKQQQMFLTERAGLTPEEAKNFFPLYFELQDKKRSYNKEAWQKLRKGKEAGTTEAEYDRIIEDVLQTRITIDQLELEYARKYKQFLSAKKIYQIQKAEMKFHRELLKTTTSPYYPTSFHPIIFPAYGRIFRNTAINFKTNRENLIYTTFLLKPTEKKQEKSAKYMENYV